MDKSFKQKTGSTQKLKSPKVELRTPDEPRDIELWAAQINANNDKRLEVKSAKVIPAFSSVILVACGAFVIVAAGQVKEMAPMFMALGVLIGLLSILYVHLLFRVRPLYEIDERGIIEHGLIGRGYGLIEWRNIQSVRTFQEKGSTSLIIKVDNYNELLERRNLLLRPYLWVVGMLSAILGGELTLSVTLGNQAQSTILERISHFSRESGRDVVAPRRGIVKEVSARAALVVFFLVVFSVLGLLGLDIYKYWMSHTGPKLEVLGASWSFLYEVPLGKSALVGDVIVQNYGGDSRGIKVELSGSAFDKGLLKQPRILVHYDEKPEDLEHVRAHTRELMTLNQDSKNVWSATSAVANMPHKDDTLMDAFKFFSPYGKSMLKQNIGWWSDTTAPNLTVEIFADASKQGSGNVILKVIPLAHPNKAFSQTLQVKCEKDYHDMQLYSAGVPKDYPVSLYPGGQVILLASNEMNFDSDAQPAQIASYYKNELEHRGWKPSVKQEKSSIELNATQKGEKRITVRIDQLPGHTPVSVDFWPSYRQVIR